MKVALSKQIAYIKLRLPDTLFVTFQFQIIMNHNYQIEIRFHNINFNYH